MNAPRNTQYRYLETQRIAGSCGAEVSGVDLSEDLSDEVLAEIRAALLDNCVIFFRDQKLTPEQQLRFARRWGEIHLHPFMQGMADYPEILEIIKTPEDKKNFGGSWHTDQMFSPQPAMGTILYALEVPSAGGDTMFTNQYLAYESLSDGMKALVSQLQTVCVGDNFKQHGGQSRSAALRPADVAHEGEGPRQRADHVGASAGAHASRDRAQGAVYRWPCAAFRRHDRRGERAADRLPEAALDAAGVHLPFPLGERIAGLLGQPLHAALRDQRLSGGDAHHAPDHGVRGHAVLN